MDLHVLQQVNRSEHLHARHEKARQIYQLGLEYLKRAQAAELDRVLLRNAARCFAAAIEHNRKDARPLLKQAYLFLLTGNGRKAVKYLQEAQRLLPPEHPAQQKKSARPTPGGPQPDKIKALYQQTEAELDRLMAKAYRELPNLQPTWASPVWRGYCKLQQEYDAAYQKLCERLDQLSPYLDTQRLDQQLQKLEISLNRLDDICEHSESMVKLRQRIETAQQALEHKLSLARSGQLSPEAHQQALSDDASLCDELADELDLMEGSGFNVAALIPGYEALVASYQALEQHSGGIA
jgi:hypothetical protein